MGIRKGAIGFKGGKGKTLMLKSGKIRGTGLRGGRGGRGGRGRMN